MELSVIDFNETAKRLLLSQYKRENFLDVFAIMAKLMEAIQVGNFQLRDMMWLESATGKQLDLIGRLWNVQRYGKSDTEYRMEIYTQIQQSVSGTPNEIINAMVGVYGGTYAEYYPVYPGCFFIESDAVISQQDLESISPSGVGVMLYDPNQFDDLTILKYNHPLKDSPRNWICDSSFNFISLTEVLPECVLLNKDTEIVIQYTSGKVLTYSVE